MRFNVFLCINEQSTERLTQNNCDQALFILKIDEERRLDKSSNFQPSLFDNHFIYLSLILFFLSQKVIATSH